MEAPSEIGPYLIESVLRVGGTSIVYRAVQDTLRRHVALKVLALHLEHDPVAAERFRQEAVSAARLKHPNIVVIHEAKVAPPAPYYIAMEFLEGGSLADRLCEGRRLAHAEVLSITRQVSAGLEHAHKRDLVHCDIKPGNIMFHADGRVAITDFGISRVVDQATVTIAAGRSGTLEYMSPEQVRGEDVDRRSDVYSLGVVVYQMLTGRTPFRGTEPLVVMRQILDDEPPAPRSLNPEIPLRVEAVLLKVLAKDRANRHREAMGFYGELARAYRGRTEWWRKVALAAALLAAAAMIGLVASRIQKRTAPPPISPPPAVIKTPDLTDMTMNDAQNREEVKSHLLKLVPAGGMYRDETAGLIYDQEPHPGGPIAEGRNVKVFLSFGPRMRMVEVCAAHRESLPGRWCKTTKVPYPENRLPANRCTSCRPQPPSMRTVRVCAKHRTLLAGTWCQGMTKPFAKGAEPTVKCTECREPPPPPNDGTPPVDSY